MPPSKESSKGFTLLEAVIAAGLLAAGTVVFLSVWVMIAIGAKSQRLIVAHHIASAKIDELRQTAFDALPSSGPFSDPMLGELPDGSAELAVSDYLGVADMKRVEVNVSWREANSTTTYRLDTVITRGATYQPQ